MTIKTKKGRHGLYMVTVSQGVHEVSIVDLSRSRALKIALKYIHEDMRK